MIVVDTNIIVYFHVAGDYTDAVWQIYQQDSQWCAPFLWRSEFRNTMLLYLRKGLLTLDEVKEFARAAEQILLDNEFHLPSNEVLYLAQNSQCSAYDCEFVALAQALGVKLVTADKRILHDFPETAVSPQQFMNG